MGLHPTLKKNTPAQFDLMGKLLNKGCTGTRHLPKMLSSGGASKFTPSAAEPLALSDTEKRDKRPTRKDVQDFLREFDKSRAVAEARRRIQARQLEILRRYAPEPTWLGVGQKTPREMAIAQRRLRQTALTRNTYRLHLGPGYEYVKAEVTNIAATFNLGVEGVDNQAFLLARDGILGHLGIRQFHACSVYPLLEDYGKVVAVRLFHSGKVTIAGARSWYEALTAAHLFVRYMRNHGVDCNMLNFRIVNVVLVFDLDHFVDIVKMSSDFPRTNLARYIRPLEASGLVESELVPLIPLPYSLLPQSVPCERADEEPGSTLALLSSGTMDSLSRHWSDDPRDRDFPEPEVGQNDKFAAVIVHIEKLRTSNGVYLKPPAISLNCSGKGILCGASTIEHARSSMERAARFFARYRSLEKSTPQKTRAAFGAHAADVFGVRGIVAHVAATVARERRDQSYAMNGISLESGNYPEPGDDDYGPTDSECLAELLNSQSFGECLDELLMCEYQEEGVADVTITRLD